MLVGHNESGFTNGTHSVADNLYVIGYLVYDSPDLPRAEHVHSRSRISQSVRVLSRYKDALARGFAESVPFLKRRHLYVGRRE